MNRPEQSAGTSDLPDTSSSRRPLLSVALCTRNRAALLARAIASVLPQLDDDGELLIVDNASSDATPALAQTTAAAHPRVRALQETKPGLSAARNTALQAARGRFVIFLDDDARAEPGWLEAYRNFFRAPPSDRIAVVGGAVEPDFEVPPPKWFSGEQNKFDLGPAPQRITEHRGPWGCNIAYERDAALRAGGFNLQLGRKGTSLGSHEEMDLNLRLETLGREIWWLPGARIRHFIGAERVRLRWRLRSEFEQSRSRVTIKFRNRPRRSARLLYGCGRVLIAPPWCAVNLVLASLTWPFGNGRFAVRSLTRAARTAGIATELLARSCRPAEPESQPPRP
jgi:glycosyltransferase involved in cell wall biosynthesis